MLKSSFLLSLVTAMLAADASNENLQSTATSRSTQEASLIPVEETTEIQSIRDDARRSIGRELNDD